MAAKREDTTIWEICIRWSSEQQNGESDPVCVKLGKLFEVQSQMAK